MNFSNDLRSDVFRVSKAFGFAFQQLIKYKWIHRLFFSSFFFLNKKLEAKKIFIRKAEDGPYLLFRL